VLSKETGRVNPTTCQQTRRGAELRRGTETAVETWAAATIGAKAKIELTKAGITSAEAKLDAAQVDIEEVQAEYRVVAADCRKAVVLLRPTQVRSPIDGVVTRTGYHVGEFVRTVATGSSVALFTIIRTGKVRIVVQVPDRDASFLDKGDSATFRTNT
jgi:HlyD family secretion protein